MDSQVVVKEKEGEEKEEEEWEEEEEEGGDWNAKPGSFFGADPDLGKRGIVP